MKNSILALFLVLLAAPNPGTAQDQSAGELYYEVSKIYPYISISKAALDAAHTLSDLHARYPTSWIKEYIAVAITTTQQGTFRTSRSKNDTLSQEQKKLLSGADLGTDILVEVQYIPANSLSQNEPKIIDFTFSIDPEKEAAYEGGVSSMRKYLQEKAIGQIPEGTFQGYDFTAVQFTVTAAGEIENPHIFAKEYQTAKYEATNELLLVAIRNMPCWTPAAYANGTTTSQEWVLLVGNKQNCVAHLLNLQRDSIGR
ncbi:MAG: energy transducer TonB [Bacteroidota bacterium]